MEQLYTWNSTDKKPFNQIDYKCFHKRFRNALINVKTKPGIDCYINYISLCTKTHVRLKGETNSVRTLDWTKMFYDQMKKFKSDTKWLWETYRVIMRNLWSDYEKHTM